MKFTINLSVKRSLSCLIIASLLMIPIQMDYGAVQTGSNLKLKSEESLLDITETSKDFRVLLGERLANFNSDAYKHKNVSYEGGYEGQCTWYCIGRAYEKTGLLITMAPNAKKWLSIDLPAGAVVVRDKEKVRADAIAVMTSTKWGHVIYVEAVQNGWVYYSEANIPMDNKVDTRDGILKRLKISDFTSHMAGYIYLN